MPAGENGQPYRRCNRTWHPWNSIGCGVRSAQDGFGHPILYQTDGTVYGLLTCRYEVYPLVTRREYLARLDTTLLC